jgi:hypothetical protein
VVDDFVTGLGEVCLQELAELESGVIGGDVDAHALILWWIGWWYRHPQR